MQAILKQQIAQGSRLYTDEYFIYPRLAPGASDIDVFNTANGSPEDIRTLKALKATGGHLKPVLVAQRRSITPKHLQRYLTEADVKHNLGLNTDFTALILAQLIGTKHGLPSK
jgi:fructose-1,6-bisphosphatase/sedoheptulose 1,7-bisphosphatase-like protein